MAVSRLCLSILVLVALLNLMCSGQLTINEEYYQSWPLHTANLVTVDQLMAMEKVIHHLNTTVSQMDSTIQQLNATVNHQNVTLQQQATKIKIIEKTVSKRDLNDCSELWALGVKLDGRYTIRVQLNGTYKYIQVYCEFTKDGGSTRIQRRQDGSVNFNRDWNDYKWGFGDIDGEHWLGNENIHALTSKKSYILVIDLELWNGTRYYAEYKTFNISDESDYYRLHVADYSGTAGDALWQNDNPDHVHNNMQFSTRDMDHDKVDNLNCSDLYCGGWWFNACYQSHLNGVYWTGGTCSTYNWDCIQWKSIGRNKPYRTISMKIKDPAIKKTTT